MKSITFAVALFAAIPAQASTVDIVKQDLACLRDTSLDMVRGNFTTTVWPVWFQRLAGVRSLQAGQVSPCMPPAP